MTEVCFPALVSGRSQLLVTPASGISDASGGACIDTYTLTHTVAHA